jgi:hypothetical protein
VRRDLLVLVSPPSRTDRHTFIDGGIGGLLSGRPLRSTWSNEGVFAFLQGLRRLYEIGGDRTDLPRIDLEIDCG